MALLLTLKIASSCGYSDGGTSRKNSLDLVMKAIRSVITCPDFDINSERAQKAVMCATKLLHWAEKNEDRFNDCCVSHIPPRKLF